MRNFLSAFQKFNDRQARASAMGNLWGAVCKATQYKILHHFLVKLRAISYIVAIYVYCCNMCEIVAIYVYCCNLCKLLQFTYIAKKTLNRLLIAMVIC